MVTINILLASTSPRRQALLTQVGVNFDIMAVDIDERISANESATDYIARMVHTKADKACELLTPSNTPALILTADTIGVLANGQILVKPDNREDAFAMWRQMSDACHEVQTAVCATLVRSGRVLWQRMHTECTKVWFITLTEEKMQRYWQSGEPADKAGGYGIQGLGATWVRRIEGDYSNVVGLPLVATLELIESGLSQINVTQVPN